MDLFASMSLFRRVAEAGSFSVVGREMGYSQPTVSKRVAALEERLGNKLISRSTRQLTLTEAGKHYYDRCVRILDEIAETEAEISLRHTQATGTLRIHAPISLGRRYLLPHVWTFLDLYPDLQIDLVLDDHCADLIKDGVDVAIRVGLLVDSTLIARKIGDSPRITIASPGYLATHDEPRNVQELKAHNCIVYNLLSTGDEWHFIGPRGHETTRVCGRFRSNSPDAIREAVLDGRGIAVMPRWLIGDCVAKGLVLEILSNYVPIPLEIHALFPERRFVPAKVLLFIDYLRKVWKLGENPSPDMFESTVAD